jgi:hypothetical protein
MFQYLFPPTSVLKFQRLMGGSRGPAFDSRSYQIFWEVVDLERGPPSLVRIIEELLE